MIHRILFALLAVAATIIPATAQSSTDPLFPLPEVPDELTSLQDRTGYLLEHYWDRCNFKQALSSKAKFAKSFDTYVDLMKAGSRHAVMRSIYKLLGSLEKQPKELLFVVQQAEAIMYSDTATFRSDEAYIPFARAIAENKKIDRDTKEHYAAHARILSGSAKGMEAPKLQYTDSLGVSHTLDADTAQYVILFFNDPRDVDSMISRGRIAANPTANLLVKKGLIRIAAITPGKPDNEWKSLASRYPEGWIVGAAPDAASIYDLRNFPTIYVLDKNLNIIDKGTSTNQLINLFNSL